MISGLTNITQLNVYNTTTGEKLFDIPANGIRSFEPELAQYSGEQSYSLNASATFTTDTFLGNAENLYEYLFCDNSIPPNRKFAVVMEVSEHIQIRRHRKRRINEKWLKRYGCRKVVNRLTGEAMEYTENEDGLHGFMVRNIRIEKEE